MLQTNQSIVDDGEDLVTENLIGWWKLDEGSGTVANDSSGLGNHGTITGDPVWTNDGDGYYLDCANKNSKIDLPESLISGAEVRATGYTQNVWFRQDAYQSASIEGGLFCLQYVTNYGECAQGGIVLTRSTGWTEMFYYLYNSSYRTLESSCTTDGWCSADWHMASSRLDPTVPRIELYVDGVFRDGLLTSTNVNTSLNYRTLMAGVFASSTNYFWGDFASARMYGAPLSAARIADLYALGPFT